MELKQTGVVTFRGLDILVGRGVFTPQPETGSLIDWVLEHLALPVNATVVDLCSGSGTLALCLASELERGTRIHAVERSPDAFAWLRRNIESNEVLVTPHLEDAATALGDLDGSVDLVVSNPPYVASHEDTALPDDPLVSVDGGADGLAVIRVVSAAAMRLLKPGCFVVIEHSDRQGITAPALLKADGWLEVSAHLDHDGHDRFVCARRP